MMAYCCFRYETMARFSPCIYLPFYIVAIYALIMEKEWIRIPCEFAYTVCNIIATVQMETVEVGNIGGFGKLP